MCLTPNHIWQHTTKGVKSCSVKFKMSRKTNKVAVEWLDAGKRHNVNVKHIIEQLQEVTVGGKVVVKLSSRRYRMTVVDLLDWAPPKRKQKAAKKKATKEKQSTKVHKLTT